MPQPRRLFVHIGMQKSGTSYLQAAMLGGREGLAAQGLDLVPPTKQQSFELMVVVRDRYAARRDPETDRNVLARFAEQLERAPGPVAVLSQESLAAAGPQQIRRLLEVCGDREVHVVATVRDLARQLPSTWQEELKAGGTTTFAEHLEQLQALERAGSRRRAWIHLDPPAVLQRWAEALAPGRVHVVTVPPPGSPETLLLERFARVLGVSPAAFAPEDRRSNSSLGQVQAELLRRVNVELPEETHRRHVYGNVVKRFFGAQVLSVQERRRILVPAELRGWCDEVAERQVAELADAGYHVEGSLEELRCADSAFAPSVQEPTEPEIAAASVTALATMLAMRGRAEERRSSGRIEVRRDGVLDRVRRRLGR